MTKIRICIDHLNEIFDSEDVATNVDFGTLYAVADRAACELRTEGIHLSGPITHDHIYHLYQIQ
jgi:hypothetical protein